MVLEMNYRIKKLPNGDFKVVYEKPHTSYNIPVRYTFIGKRIGMR